MTALPDEVRSRAACAGIDPRTMYEDAWNDKTGRPAPGLAKALSICGRCPITLACLVAGLDEPWGVWGGAVPPERGQVRGIRYATDAEPLEIIHRLGETTVRITEDGTLVFNVPDHEPLPRTVTAADIDTRYRDAWDAQARLHGSYADIPPEVQEALSEGHRQAHVRRAASERQRAAGKVQERYPAALCPEGHDITGYLPSGKPVLTPTGRCRLCQPAEEKDPAA